MKQRHAVQSGSCGEPLSAEEPEYPQTHGGGKYECCRCFLQELFPFNYILYLENPDGFQRPVAQGIQPNQFAELLLGSGLVLNEASVTLTLAMSTAMVTV